MKRPVHSGPAFSLARTDLLEREQNIQNLLTVARLLYIR